MRFRSLRSITNQSTLRTPRRFAALHPSLFPNSTSAHPTGRPLSPEGVSLFFHGCCHYEGPVPFASRSSFDARFPCPGFLSFPVIRGRSLGAVGTSLFRGLIPLGSSGDTHRAPLSPLPLNSTTHRLPGFHGLRPRLRGLDPPKRALAHPESPPGSLASPLQVSLSLGVLPTPRPPGSPGLSAHDIPALGLREDGLARVSTACC